MPRARWYYRPGHPRANANGFVAEEDLGDTRPVEPERVPVVTDRYMEGVRAPDAQGTDIGSRAKRREYMARNGYVDADDYKGVWQQAEKIRREGDPEQRKARREVLGRVAYELEKRGRK